MDTETNIDLSKLSDSDKREIQTLIVAEGQKASINKTISTLTDMCWTKCITSRISGGKLERSEESCAVNCVERFMDTNVAVLKHLETMRGSGSL